MSADTQADELGERAADAEKLRDEIDEDQHAADKLAKAENTLDKCKKSSRRRPTSVAPCGCAHLRRCLSRMRVRASASPIQTYTEGKLYARVRRICQGELHRSRSAPQSRAFEPSLENLWGDTRAI
jgi:hypothetical protein